MTPDGARRAELTCSELCRAAVRAASAVVGAAQVVEDVDENLDPWDDDLWERWASIIDTYADPSLILA